ncbi:MAG: class IV adenylate cyclase [Desulfurococcales archaeon]|nr:class IV adenylate cyclase [Desulfurococcales archaeon]
MLEVEKKIIIPCDFMESLRVRLEKAGFSLEWNGLEVDRYYQHPCKDFSVTDEAFRLREVISGGVSRFVLTWKGPKVGVGVKAREEVNFGFDGDVGRLESILSRLGFSGVAVVRKERSVYSGLDVKVYLDHISGLGCFVEVEALGEYSIAKTFVDRAVHILELDSYPSTVKSYLELVSER